MKSRDFELFIHHLSMFFITSNNRNKDKNVVALVNRFWTSSVKCRTANFRIQAG